MNIFEIASKDKLRFPYKGMITSEDLWDLNSEQLDGIYKALNSGKKAMDEESLLDTKSNEDVTLDVKIQIVKYIFDKKREEADAKRMKLANDEKRRRLKELIANKQDEELKGMSLEDLKKMLAETE